MPKVYSFVSHNPQAIKTSDLFVSFFKKNRTRIYRMPYKNRFTVEETRDYIFEEFIRLVLLDVIENNTIFVFPKRSLFQASIQKEAVTGERFKEKYKLGRFKLDYMKSNFTGHFLVMHIDKMTNGKHKYKSIFLSGDLKTKRDKASEIW